MIDDIEAMSIRGEDNLLKLQAAVKSGKPTANQLRHKIFQFRYGVTELGKRSSFEKEDLADCLLSLIRFEVTLTQTSDSSIGSKVPAAPSDHSKDFVGHIFGFLRHRRAIDEVWRLSCAGKKSVVEELPSCDDVQVGSRYNGSCRQMSLCSDPPRPVATFAELYETAAVAREIFSDFLLNDLPELLALSPTPLRPGDCVVAPLKGEVRAREKALDDYGDRDPGPPASWLFDIVRGSVTCGCEAQIVAIVKAIRGRKDMHVVRLKNRFKKPTPAGFRDINVNIKIEIFEGSGIFHTVELQIHHVAIKNFEAESHSHVH